MVYAKLEPFGADHQDRALARAIAYVLATLSEKQVDPRILLVDQPEAEDEVHETALERMARTLGAEVVDDDAG